MGRLRRSASPRLGYLALILIGPILMMVWRTLGDLDAAWAAIKDPDTISAFKLTLMVTAIAVVVNTVFGIVCALLIVRGKIPGRGFLNAFVDLPLSLSPVIVGFALVSLYSAQGWLGWFQRNGYEILFAKPSIILATIFVTLPFVVREVVPTLREIGTEQEQAAQTLGAIGLADVLARHAAGDPVGGHLRRRPHGRPRDRRVRRGRGRVRATSRARRRRPRFGSRTRTSSRTANYAPAYGIAFVLAATAVIILLAMIFLQPKESRY